MPDLINVVMHLDKITPGTYRYEAGKEGSLWTLYLRKSAFPHNQPAESIVVTVRPA